MKFLLFDFGATLVFLLAYLSVVNARRRRVTMPVARPAPRPSARPVTRGGEWPRLSQPR